MSNLEHTSIDELWNWACNGETEKLKEYYDNGGSINNRYFKFGDSHSLIMGAFRNNQFDTVEYLMSVGEEITPKEYDAMQTEMQKLNIIQRLTESNEQTENMVNEQSM